MINYPDCNTETMSGLSVEHFRRRGESLLGIPSRLNNRIAVNKKLEQFFSPSIRVKFKRGKISPDLVSEHAIWRQFSREAGFGGALYLPETAYDALLLAASKHGYSLESLMD